jgi:hypothetical protein
VFGGLASIRKKNKMAQTLIEQYDVQLQEDIFASLVASIVSAKLAGTYVDITAEVVGGWYVSAEDRKTQKAEAIADAVVKKLGK